MTRDEIQAKVDELAPWHFCFQFPYGITTGTSQPDHYEKIDVLLAAGAFSRPVYPKVLDLGANAGIVSMWFVNHKNSQVLAVEAGEKFYQQLEFAVGIKGYAGKIDTANVDITVMTSNFFSYRYDCVLLLGVLHHIPPDKRQKVVNLCYSAVNHLGEVYIQTKADIGAEDMMKQAGFAKVTKIAEWYGQNRVAWLAQKDPMKL